MLITILLVQVESYQRGPTLAEIFNYPVTGEWPHDESFLSFFQRKKISFVFFGI